MATLSGADSAAGRIEEEEYTGADHGGGGEDGRIIPLDQTGFHLKLRGRESFLRGENRSGSPLDNVV